MARKYLSPTATIFVKILLAFAEALIGLFNLISFPVRALKVKHHLLLAAVWLGCFVFKFWPIQANHALWLIAGYATWTLFTVALHLLHHYLNKKLSPKIAMLFNSPMGIPLNRFYKANACA